MPPTFYHLPVAEMSTVDYVILCIDKFSKK